MSVVNKGQNATYFHDVKSCMIRLNLILNMLYISQLAFTMTFDRV